MLKATHSMIYTYIYMAPGLYIYIWICIYMNWGFFIVKIVQTPTQHVASISYSGKENH